MSKEKEDAERDALYERINKLLEPIMKELTQLKHHRKHEIIEQLVLALFKTLCDVEMLGILDVLANKVRFDVSQKYLKEFAPDMMDTIQSVMDKQKAR